jgi:hypothetical protein
LHVTDVELERDRLKPRLAEIPYAVADRLVCTVVEIAVSRVIEHVPPGEAHLATGRLKSVKFW